MLQIVHIQIHKLVLFVEYLLVDVVFCRPLRWCLMDTVKKKLKRLEESSFVFFAHGFLVAWIENVCESCLQIPMLNPFLYESCDVAYGSKMFLQSAHSQSRCTTDFVSSAQKFRYQAPWVWQFCFSFDVLLQFGISEKHPANFEPGGTRGTVWF